MGKKNKGEMELSVSRLCRSTKDSMHAAGCVIQQQQNIYSNEVKKRHVCTVYINSRKRSLTAI
jgi:hypothetical protein